MPITTFMLNRLENSSWYLTPQFPHIAFLIRLIGIFDWSNTQGIFFLKRLYSTKKCLFWNSILLSWLTCFLQKHRSFLLPNRPHLFQAHNSPLNTHSNIPSPRNLNNTYGPANSSRYPPNLNRRPNTYGLNRKVRQRPFGLISRLNSCRLRMHPELRIERFPIRWSRRLNCTPNWHANCLSLVAAAPTTSAWYPSWAVVISGR